jgi:dienelactone hydrolase
MASSLVLVVIAALLAIPAMRSIGEANAGIERSHIMVGTVPVTVLVPSNSARELPGVVVVHGFAASSVIMEPLGRTLARAGYVVALPDVSGHGANAQPLSAQDGDRDALQADLAAVVEWLGNQSNVDAARLSLVGHSMGAGAVTRFASEATGVVRATVAISLPAAIQGNGRPQNLLLLYGSAEPAGFANAALDQARLLQADAVLGESYGDFGNGSAVSVQVVPGVEHISIIWSPLTASLTLEWISEAVGSPTGPADIDPAWLWLLLLLAAGALGAVPLARLLYRNSARAWPQPASSSLRVTTTLVFAIAVAGIVSAIGPSFESVFPIAVGGYLAVFFAVAAITLGVTGAYLCKSQGMRLEARYVIPALIMTVYATSLMVFSARLTWATSSFVGPRIWIWVCLALILCAFFLVETRFLGRPQLFVRVGLMAASRIVIVVVMLASVSLLGAPSILTLLVPFMLLLFIILGFFAIVISSQATDRMGMALVQSVPLAAIVASGFPLT